MKFKLLEEPRKMCAIEFSFKCDDKVYIGKVTSDEDGDIHNLYDENNNEITEGELFEEFSSTWFDDWNDNSEGDEIDTENLRW